MSRAPYRVTVTEVGTKVEVVKEQGYESLPEAVTGYSQTIRRCMRMGVIVTLTYRPPVEQGMFGIAMPPEVIATYTGRTR